MDRCSPEQDFATDYIQNLVFANLRVHLVHPHEVAALPVNAFRDASVVVKTLHRARADAVLAEVVRVQVVLGRHLVRD